MKRNMRRQLIGQWTAGRKLGCFWCGKPFLPGHRQLSATVEHFFPISRGGSPLPFNTVVAHDHCNKSHGGKIPDEASMRKFVHLQGKDALTALAHFAGQIVLGVAK